MNDPVVEVLAQGDDVVPRRASLEIDAPLIDVGRLSLYYGDTQALFEIVLQVPGNQVCALIGPSGCGKSTLLRCINRLNDLIDSVRIEGTLTLEGQDIYAPDFDAIELRRRVGMVFQRSNPFPKSVYENVAYGLRNVDIARQVCRRDDDDDNLRDQIFRELLTYLKGGQPDTVDRAIHLILISRHFERIGDHASNIAENAAFFVEGRIVPHQKASWWGEGKGPPTNGAER